MFREPPPPGIRQLYLSVPTHQEKPKVFDGQLVMKQVECVLPLLEVARVSQDVWYDHRRFLDTFLSRSAKGAHPTNPDCFACPF